MNTSVRVSVSKVRLPKCVTKYDLIMYFECTYRYLWRNIITEDLLEEWGYSYDDIKRMRKLPPTITARIYEHFQIKSLDRFEPLLPIEETTGNQAPPDIF